MKSAITTTKKKGVQSWPQSTRKPLYTVRHIYMTTMTVLLRVQTQCFIILTLSLPADV